MQIKMTLTFALLISIFQIGCATTNSDSRSISSLSDDLAAYSGSYKLELGKTEFCPDGEFGVMGDQFIVGANLFIGSINKGAKKSPVKSGQCQTQSKAEFDGKALTYVLDESCENGEHAQTSYQFDFSTQATSRYIKMSFKKLRRVGKGPQHSKKYTCVYKNEIDQ